MGKRLIPKTPEKIFVLIATIFGLLFLVLTPPFQSPDENRHFQRAYQISEGTLIPTKLDNRVGGYLPEKVRDCVVPYGPIRGVDDLKMSADTIWNSFYDQGSDKLVFIDFPASSVYSSISYFPQAFGIAVVRPFGATPIMALYAARIMTLICWIFVLFLSIRITPISKWLFVTLALLPMSVFIHSSVSADMITNAFAFLFIAYILKCAFSESKMSKKHFIVLVLLIALVSSAKFLYAPLVLLFLMIPARNFGGKKSFFLHFGLISLATLATPVFWSLVQGTGYISYSDYNPDYREYVNLVACANLSDQISFISNDIGVLFEVLGNSIVNNFNNFSLGYIGNFGWYEVPLPRFVVVAAYVFLFVITWLNGNSKVRMAGYQRMVLLVPFCIIALLIIFSQYLIWSCVGANEATNMQGRYFIPIIPLLFIMLYRSNDRYERFLPLAVTLFSVSALVISSFVIYNRYYVPLKYDVETITCDHETTKNNSAFTTSNENYDGGNFYSRSSEMAHTGSYSSKVSGASPFGTMLHFENCGFGDVLYIEAWKFGGNGKIVISDKGGEKLYLTSDDPNSNQSLEWEKVKLEVKIPSSILNERISCYLFNPEPSDSCYFDDIHVVLKRRIR